MKGYLLDTSICVFLLIGCAAKVAGLTMVTDNVQHLGRIEGLEIENWVER